MFLKRIEIFGFKSFADRTVIEFTDGVTALLGPNGCGKSNIVDAVKWVLGEQSVRNMRAERMDDVIFSGSEDRKALSVAEVTLIVMNEEGILDMDQPEVAIKRRIYREGEGEYFINGTPVRLKEIRELFFDTGVGKSAYSVMEQGRIDQVLSNRPEERRHLFEEAAGITRFKARGSEGERKLARTEENIVQVENILREVRKNYDSLKKQTDKALEYRVLRDRVFEHDRDLRLLQWRELEKTRAARIRNRDSRAEKALKIKNQIDEIKSTMSDQLKKVNDMESKLIENQKRLYGIDLEKQNRQKRVEELYMLRKRSREAADAVALREKNAADSLKSLKARKDERRKDLKKSTARLADVDSSISVIEQSITSAESRIRMNSDEAGRIRGDLAREEQARESFQDDLRTLTDDIVRELESRLSQYDRGARRTLEVSIADRLGELIIRVDGRTDLLRDQKAFAGGQGALKLLNGACEDLTEAAASLRELSRLFEQYRTSDVDLLEDFLAPEGIMTRKHDLDEEIVASAEQTRVLKDRLSALGLEREELDANLNQAREKLEELRVTQTQMTIQAASVRDSLDSLDRETETEQARLDEIRRGLETEQARINALDGQVEDLLALGKEFEREQEELSKNTSRLSSEIESGNKALAGREHSLGKLTEQYTKLEFEQEKAGFEMERLDADITALFDGFREKYSREFEDFTDRRDKIDASPSDIRAGLQDAKTALKDLGAVNLMAPQEFKEVGERYEFLSTQLEDLSKARDDLTEVTGRIREESAALFMESYKAIDDNFHTMFRRLFGGGKAEIRLLDSENPLNSGLEIYAQPPGKKLENISLLSGGERSLCGVALMFATFLVRPSPFCILDEIDAALDEANIQRFTALLLEFAETSQFVVITHNKKTVACAKSLMGVTMQESGVSSLIAMRLDGKERERHEEPAAAR